MRVTENMKTDRWVDAGSAGRLRHGPQLIRSLPGGAVGPQKNELVRRSTRCEAGKEIRPFLVKNDVTRFAGLRPRYSQPLGAWVEVTYAKSYQFPGPHP